VIKVDDHFSKLATDYAAGRPTYPDVLFKHLANLVNDHHLAWDCATGNGQAVDGLAPYFQQIVATDISQPLLDQASQFPNVTYKLALAEQSGLDDLSVDLITIAQALHWFEFDRFWKEVDRVLKTGGVLAFWGYNWPEIDTSIDNALKILKSEIASYWPARSAILHNEYRDVAPPFAELATPAFTFSANWNRETFLAHIRSWSAVRYKREKEGDGFYGQFANRIDHVWGDDVRRVTWPLIVKIYRN
jgi:ubiquinone/menaquinone biosynthesis C-methylase UbiE